MSKHTPTPWFPFRNYPRDSGPIQIATNDNYDEMTGDHIADVGNAIDGGCTKQDDINAEFICHAANAYSDLVEALDHAIDVSRRLIKETNNPRCSSLEREMNNLQAFMDQTKQQLKEIEQDV